MEFTIPPAAWLRRQLAFASLLLVLACQGQTCEQGETIFVRYRGAIPVEPKGQVSLNQEPIGYVESIQPKTGYSRIALRVRSAAQIHHDDRFLPAQDSSGRQGFRVAHFGGESLRPGEEIEADPRLAPMPVRIATRATQFDSAASVTRTTDRLEQRPVPDAARPPRMWGASFARTMHLPSRRVERLDPLVVRDFEALRLGIESAQTPEELQNVIDRQAVPLRMTIESARQQARQNGDRIAEHEYHRMLRMVEHVQRKSSVAARAGTRHLRPAP